MVRGLISCLLGGAALVVADTGVAGAAPLVVGNMHGLAARVLGRRGDDPDAPHVFVCGAVNEQLGHSGP